MEGFVTPVPDLQCPPPVPVACTRHGDGVGRLGRARLNRHWIQTVILFCKHHCLKASNSSSLMTLT